MDARSKVLGTLKVKQSTRQVTNVFGVPQRTISRLLQRYNANNSVLDRRESGRLRTTSRRQDNFILNLTLRNRRIIARALQSELRTDAGVSDQTIRNR